MDMAIKVACDAPQAVTDWMEKISANKKRIIASSLYLHKKHGTLSNTLALAIIQSGGSPEWAKYLDIEVLPD